MKRWKGQTPPTPQHDVCRRCILCSWPRRQLWQLCFVYKRPNTACTLWLQRQINELASVKVFFFVEPKWRCLYLEVMCPCDWQMHANPSAIVSNQGLWLVADVQAKEARDRSTMSVAIYVWCRGRLWPLNGISWAPQSYKCVNCCELGQFASPSVDSCLFSWGE